MSPCNIRNYSGPSVPEHAMALMLALSRNLFAWRQSPAGGALATKRPVLLLRPPHHGSAWQAPGIIGKGTLGQALGQRASAIGMEVYYAQSQVGSPGMTTGCPWDALLQSSDVISLHCPLTPTPAISSGSGSWP